VRALSTIAIDRKKGEDSLAQVIRQGKQRFGIGFWIIMFPEGTRIKPKTRKPFKYGVAKLAQSLNVPIVPFAHNAGYCLPRNSFWLYPGNVDVIIGKPIYSDNDSPVQYTEKIQTWVHAQLDTIGS
jgi:1-acyl-sn-glycerol-3-phosphate acyltransferase